VANSKQQAKRVRTAARQRLENLRYKTQIKTLFKRLETQVEGGDAEQAAATHVKLQGLVDRAAAHKAIHKNTASRRKSQAQRLIAGQTTAE
jgi:small subunit ribosomal protein S20